MQGTILSFHPETNTGLISGHDGVRYTFARSHWTSPKIEPKEGLTVDFDTDEKEALQIIVIKNRASKGEKRRTIAILWAFFLGVIGAHKFYLRQTFWGILYLLFFWTGIPVLITIIEIVILLLMSDEEFDRKFN